MCLCLLEYNFVQSPDRVAVLQPILESWPQNLAPLPSLTFPFVSIVPHDLGHFNKHGMSGWFQQDAATCLFKLQIDNLDIPVMCIDG